MTARNYKVVCRICLTWLWALLLTVIAQEDSETPDNRSRQGSGTCSIDFELDINYAVGIVIMTGQFDASAEICIPVHLLCPPVITIAMLFKVLSNTW